MKGKKIPYRPGNTDLRGLKVEIGHNGVIHTLDRGPNLVAKGQIGGTINFKISDRADLPLFSQIGAENVKILDRFQIGIRSVPDRGLQIGVSRSVSVKK